MLRASNVLFVCLFVLFLFFCILSDVGVDQLHGMTIGWKPAKTTMLFQPPNEKSDQPPCQGPGPKLDSLFGPCCFQCSAVGAFTGLLCFLFGGFYL